MTRPTGGRAAIQIVGDVSKFAPQLQRDVDAALRSVHLNTAPISKQLGTSLSQGVDAAGKAFTGLEADARDSFRVMSQQALRAGFAIEQSMSQGTADISTMLAQEIAQGGAAAAVTAAAVGNATAEALSAGLVGGLAGTGAQAGIGIVQQASVGMVQNVPAAAAAGRVIGDAAGEGMRTGLAQRGPDGRFIAKGLADGVPAAFVAGQAIGEAASKGAASTEGSMRRAGGLLGATLKTAALGSVAALATGLGSLAVTGLKAAATLEQVQVQFASLTGSVTKGRAQFEALQKFAAATPFEFSDLTTAAARFDAFAGSIGHTQDELIPFLTTIGNVVSATGGGAQALDSVSLAMGQIASRGKVTLDNINQLSNAMPGFSGVAAIAAAEGVSQAQAMDLISSGSLDAKKGIEDLLLGMQKFPGAASAMQKQSETLLGVFSTFKDVTKQALVGAFEPVIPSIKASLVEITPVIGEALKGLAPALGGVVAQLLPFLANLIKALGPALTPVLDALSIALKVLGPALIPIGDALGQLLGAVLPLVAPLAELVGHILAGLGPILATLTPLFTGLTDVIVAVLTPLIPIIDDIVSAVVGLLAPAMTVLGQIFSALAPVIGPIIVAIGQALAPLLGLLAQLLEPLLGVVAPLLPVFAELTPPLVEIVIALTPLIELIAELLNIAVLILVPIIKLNAALAAFLLSKAIAPLLKLIAQALVFVLKPVELLVPLLQSVSEWLQNIDWGATGKAIGGAFSDAWDAVVTFFTGIGKWFSELPAKIGSFLASLPGALVGAITRAFDAMLIAVGIGIALLIAAVTILPGKILNALAALPALLGSFFAGLWAGVTSTAATAVTTLVAAALALPGQIWTALQALPGLVGSLFSSAFNAAKAAVTAGIVAIVGFVTSVPGKLSALKDRMLAAGVALIKGFTSGLSQIGGFIGDVAGSIVKSITGFLNHIIGKINEGIAAVDDKLPGFSLPRLPQLARGGLTTDTVIAQLHPSEMVLPLQSRSAVDLLSRALAEAQAGLTASVAQGGAGVVEVRVFIGNREITDIVRVEISERDRALKQRVLATAGTPR